MKLKIYYILTLLSLSSCLAVRFVGWNFADIRDHKKFKNRPIEAPDQPFTFHELNEDISITYENETGRPLEEVLDEHKTVAFLIIRRDTILYEKYFGRYEQTDPVPSFSMAKSFVGVLVAMAVDEGHIGSLEDPIDRYIPELEGDPLFSQLTLQHIMDQRSGLAFNEQYLNPFSDVAKFYYGRKLKKYIEDIEFKGSPGDPFDYNSLNTQLLGIVLERTTGKKLAEYLEEKIWLPLGMEAPASWSIDSKKWDTEKAFCCLNAIARDYAKFGRLMLLEGKWDGQQIVPRWYIDDLYDHIESKERYRNQWWLHGTATRQSYYAQGFLGQFIYVVPEEDMIFVRLGKKYGKKYWPLVFQVVMDKIYPEKD